MDILYKTQVELLNEFRREYVNFNKTSRGRKTTKYRDAKLEVSKKLWEEYGKTHSEVRKSSTAASDEYEKNHLEIKELYGKWANGLQAIKELQPLEPDPKDEPELALQLKQQNVRFNNIRKDLNLVLEKVDQNEVLSKAYCKMRVTALNTLWERVTIANENFLADVGVPPVSYTDQLADIEELLDQVMLILQGKIEESNHTPPNGQEGVKLQRVTIQKFTGDYCKWVSFRDLFTTMVIENRAISDAQRLQLLKTYVGGEVEGLIADLSISNANFQAAWTRLCERYDNNRVIVYRYMSKLFTQQVVKGDTQSLKKLLDTTEQILLALRNLGRPTDQWDDWIVMIITQKMCDENRKDWEKRIADSRDLPTWTQLKNFLDEEFRMLEGVESGQRRHQSGYPAKPNKFIKSYQTTVEKKSCPACEEDHWLYACEQFRNMAVKERWAMAKKEQLCFGCLRGNHDKMSCKIKKPCKNCNRQHSTWLHEDRPKKFNRDIKSNAAIKKEAEEPKNIAVAAATITRPQVLLATAVVETRNHAGQKIRLRALIDQGSQGSMITKRAADYLRFTLNDCIDSVQPLGRGSSPLTKSLTIKLWPHFKSTFEMEIECYVMKKLTSMLPNEDLYIQNWKHLKGLQLADPKFHKRGNIDILLGMDIMTEIMEEKLIKGTSGEPMAQQTKLGWLVAGKIDSTYAPHKINCMLSTVVENEEQLNLRKFWELEDLNPERSLTPEEQFVENHYKKTVAKTIDGKFIVTIPFKEYQEGPDTLGSSKQQATARFFQLEKKFARNQEMKKEYIQVMEEYISLGHMKLVPEGSKKAYYIPHHAVFKPDSLTTKMRVVFDASARTSTGRSLNDCMYVGGKTQDELFEILVRWRKHKIVFKADVEKMYRKIVLNSEDQKYHTVLWRKSPNEDLREYQLTTVTFGTASAPYLATRTLIQRAEEIKEDLPQTAAIIKKDFYVDDLISGCQSVSEAIQRKNELLQTLGDSDLQLRKWTSNSKEFLETLPSILTEKALQSFEVDDTTKALGLKWNPRTDEFNFSVVWQVNEKDITKRELLSEASKLFDPLGWLAPTIVNAKLLMQGVWLSKIGWDEKVPETIEKTWIQLRDELHLLEKIKIPRYIKYEEGCNIQLHGFCDASEKAYSAVVYTRIESTEGVRISLIASKTRVAPINMKTTLPRLELCGATLLANLLKKVKKSLNQENIETYAWSDSMIT